MRFLITTVLLCFVGLTHAARQKFTVQPFFNVKGTMIGVIGLGTPTQPTTMELNPTTPEFFVIPSNCKTSGCHQNRKGFDVDKSSTYSDNGRQAPFATNYMGGQSTGIIAKESLTALAIPGRDPPSIPLPVVDEPKGDLVNGPATGVMGMGFLPENSKQPGTFLQGLMKNLDLPVFEIYLQSYTYSKAKDVSTYGNVTYGNKDTDHCEEQHVMFKTLGPRDWTIKIDSAAIGSSPLNAGTAMFYPGSPRIHAPTAVVRAIRNRIHARLDTSTNEYYVDCRCLKRLPRLYLTIGGQKLVFYPREYVAKLDNTNKCMLMIQTASNRYKGADWILGDPALRENCVFYDFAVPQVGLARHK